MTEPLDALRKALDETLRPYLVLTGLMRQATFETMLDGATARLSVTIDQLSALDTEPSGCTCSLEWTGIDAPLRGHAPGCPATEPSGERGGLHGIRVALRAAVALADEEATDRVTVSAHVLRLVLAALDTDKGK